MARNYKLEYKNYHSKPEQKKRRANRNAARDIMEKKGLVKKGDKKDRNTKNNKPSNLRVTSRAKNRSRNGTKKK